MRTSLPNIPRMKALIMKMLEMLKKKYIVLVSFVFHQLCLKTSFWSLYKVVGHVSP